MALCKTVTPEDVKRSVAEHLRSEEGEQQAAYLIGRLGVFGAEAYLLRLEGQL